MERMGFVLGVRPENVAEYKRVHASVWPEILEALSGANIHNYSIFLREPENLLFAVWDYTGDDFETDQKRIAASPRMKEWWELCGPMQVPLDSRRQGEWWSPMEEVFHHP